MKRLFAFLLLIITPTFCWAGDHCTNPDKYTIDKRCYVTDAQKNEIPYSATVALVEDNGYKYCSGTIVEDKNILYVFTAKHCMHGKTKHKILLHNGDYVYAYKVEEGDFYYKGGQPFNMISDYAVLEIRPNDEDVPFVHVIERSQSDDARLIGYGKLKIMSDAEIKNFKQQYLSYLQKKYPDITDDSMNMGVKNKDSVKWRKSKQFKEDLSDVFKDEKLKVSFCKYSVNGELSGCQGWHGDSGAGIFDNNSDIMGIMVAGEPYLSEGNYAVVVGSVNLQSINKDNVLDFISDITQ